MKKKHWIIKLILFLVISCAVLYGAMAFLFMPYARDSSCMYGFRLEPDDSLDVVLIGPSSFYTAFYSPLAYEKAGFTSYSLSVSGMTAILYETAMEETLAHHHPDLFVVDIKGFYYDEQADEVAMHKFLDSIPYTSPARSRAIRTYVPEEMRSRFLNPWLEYHGEGIEFEDCAKVLLDKIRQRLRGFSVTKNYSSQTIIKSTEGSQEFTMSEEGLQVARNFLDYCHANQVEHVLFVRNPVPVAYESGDAYYELLDMIEEAGYDYLDLHAMQAEMGIEQYHDWADKGHFNIFGSEKYTCFLSEYLMEHYDINTEHSEKVTEEWEECKSYNDHILSYLKQKCEEQEDGYHFRQSTFIGDYTYY